MRGVPVWLCLLFAFSIASAQSSEVRIGSLLLTKEPAGWRVFFADPASRKYALESGDLLTRIDSEDASRMGPLAVTAAFNAAFARSVPLIAQRDAKQVNIILWRSDGAAPPPRTGVTNTQVSEAEEAPDFDLPTLSNVRVRLSAQRGKWVLISFWATWCTPCEQEAVILNRLAKDYSPKLAVFALAVSDKRERLTAFAAKIHPLYTILDAGSLTAEPALSYGVGNRSGGGSVPVNLLVRPNGTIAYVQGGYEAPSPLEKQVSMFLTANP